MKIHKSLIKRNENHKYLKSISNTIIKFQSKNFSSSFSNVTYDPNNDYYKVLNISDKADLKEIKKSFYKLSLESHPDKGGNEENFKKINNAYEILKDEKQKQQYDLIRKEYLAAFDIKFNSIKNKNDFSSGNRNKEKYGNSHYNANSSSRSDNRNHYSSYSSNKHNNFYNNFYRQNNYENSKSESNQNNYNSNEYNNNFYSRNEYNNNNYYSYYKTYNSQNTNNNHFYDFYDFEKHYKRDNEEFKNYFYEYYEDLLKKANFSFRDQYRKYYTKNNNNDFNNNSKSERDETSEKQKQDKKAKVIRDSVNDFNYLNDNLISSRYDNRTISYFESFKINRLQKPQKEFKFEKFKFTQDNIHFSEKRIEILNEELKEFEKNSFFKKKFILNQKPQFKNNPFEFDSIKYNEKSEFNIKEAMDSKEERDSERINNRLQLKHFYNLMDKKIFVFYLTVVLSINYLLFRKNN